MNFRSEIFARIYFPRRRFVAAHRVDRIDNCLQEAWRGLPVFRKQKCASGSPRLLWKSRRWRARVSWIPDVDSCVHDDRKFPRGTVGYFIDPEGTRVTNWPKSSYIYGYSKGQTRNYPKLPIERGIWLTLTNYGSF